MLQNKVVQVSVVIVCALVIWFLINPVADTVPVMVGNIAAFLIMGFFASTVVSAIYRVAKGSWPKWQVWISVPFIAIFMYLAYVGMQFEPQGFTLEAASSKSSDNNDHSEEIRIDDVDGWLKAVQSNPDDARAWHHLGLAYGRVNHHNASIDAYRQALRIDPGNASTWYNLGRVYEILNRYNDSIDAFRQAILINPDDTWAWTGLGIVYERLNRHNDAIDAFRQAFRIDPDNALAWHHLGRVYGKLNRYDDAIDAFREAIRINPDFTLAWFGLGVAYHFSGKRGNAMDAIKELRRLDPVMANELFDILVPR